MKVVQTADTKDTEKKNNGTPTPDQPDKVKPTSDQPDKVKPARDQPDKIKPTPDQPDPNQENEGGKSNDMNSGSNTSRNSSLQQVI